MGTRKHIGLRLPEELIEHIDAHCARTGISRTEFIEEQARKALLPLPTKDSGWRWQGDLEDMPLDI